MSWSDRQEVQLGDLGERLVDGHLKSKGAVVYKPDGGPHPFDRLCATIDKRAVFVAEAKTKPARKHYPDTGFNVTQYVTYKFIEQKHRLRVFIHFVDHDAKQIYGGWLHKLEEPRSVTHKDRVIEYPLRQNGVIYFPLEAMQHIADLNEESVRRLSALSQRAADYK